MRRKGSAVHVHISMFNISANISSIRASAKYSVAFSFHPL